MQYPAVVLSLKFFPKYFCLVIAAVTLHSMLKTIIDNIVYETLKKSKAKS
jgi:hypothetical protein